MSETAFGSLLLRIQLEVFLSSCDLASVSLFLNWKQYKIFVNLSSRSLPWYLYFLFLVVRAPPNHTSELWSGTWSRCSLLLLIWLKKLKARYLRSPGKILLVNVSCPLFTLVSFYELSQIDYHWAGKKKKQQAHHMPLARICQSSAPSLRRLGSDTWVQKSLSSLGWSLCTWQEFTIRLEVASATTYWRPQPAAGRRQVIVSAYGFHLMEFPPNKSEKSMKQKRAIQKTRLCDGLSLVYGRWDIFLHGWKERQITLILF